MSKVKDIQTVYSEAMMFFICPKRKSSDFMDVFQRYTKELAGAANEEHGFSYSEIVKPTIFDRDCSQVDLGPRTEEKFTALKQWLHSQDPAHFYDYCVSSLA